MKKIITLFLALILASSTFTSCGNQSSQSEQEQFIKLINDMYTEYFNAEFENECSYSYPADIVDLIKEQGNLNLNNLDEEKKKTVERVKLCSFKLEDVKVVEEMSEYQLFLTEKYLSELYYDLKNDLSGTEETFDGYNYGFNGEEMLYNVTKGYKLTANIKIGYSPEYFTSESTNEEYPNRKTEDTTELINVFYIEGEGWKADRSYCLETEFIEHSLEDTISIIATNYINKASLPIEDYFIISNDKSLDYNVPDAIDPDELRNKLKKIIQGLGNTHFFIVSNNNCVQYIVTSEKGDTIFKTYDGSRNDSDPQYLYYNADYRSISKEIINDDDKYTYSDLHDLAVKAIDSYRSRNDS
ncbi:MAG: hypothetical protein J6Y71_09440 [Ruminococcus sp.]|nr:hypothetical protein [Ruminococcus sp.]